MRYKKLFSTVAMSNRRNRGTRHACTRNYAMSLLHSCWRAPSSGAAKKVAVLNRSTHPDPNSSQGLYIEILKKAGFEAQAINAHDLRKKRLEGFDIFIIGGGSGTAFNKSLGADGCKIVREFVRKGGGVLASCAGGYSFSKGDNKYLKRIVIAKANVIDIEDGRWARGKGNVEITPADDRYRPIQTYYANGPLWEIFEDQRTDRTVALARFNGDIKKEGDAGGIMPGTPAILGGTYGAGRFVLFSAHPEFHKKLGNHRLISDAGRWVTRGRLQPDEQIRWADVFPNSAKLESTKPNASEHNHAHAASSVFLKEATSKVLQ